MNSNTRTKEGIEQTTIHHAEPWTLRVRSDGEVVATKTIPYDGVMVFTTAPIRAPGGVPSKTWERHGSQANLPVETVITRYAEAVKSIDKGTLRKDVLDALRSDGVATNGGTSVDLLGGGR